MAKNLFDFRIYLALVVFITIYLSFFKKDKCEKIKAYFELHSKIIVPILTLILFIYFTIIKYYSWKSGGTSGTDFSHFDYALWNIANGRGPIISIDDSLYYKHLFGNHFAPILYLFSLPYLLFTSHLIPYLFQSFFLSLTFFICFKITKDLCRRFEFENSSFLSLLLSTGLISFQYTLRIFKYEFHHEIIYLPLGLWVMYEIILSIEFKEKRLFPLFSSLILYLAVKEDAPLNLLGPFLWAILKAPKKNKVYWSLGILFLVIYFFVIFKKVMPLYAIDPSKNNFIPMWGKYGKNIVEIAKTVIISPHLVVADILGNKAFFKLYLPWLFIPFLSWSILITLPALIVAMTASNTQFKELLLYYSAPLVPLVYISYLCAIRRFPKFVLRFVTASLLINLLIGIGTLRLDFANPDLKFIKNDGQTKIDDLLQNLKEGEVIYVSGGLLPQIDYSLKLKRIMDLNFASMVANNVNAVILAPTLNMYPLRPEDLPQLEENLIKENYILDFKSELFKIYKKRI